MSALHGAADSGIVLGLVQLVKVSHALAIGGALAMALVAAI
jgi:hypothetical protein